MNVTNIRNAPQFKQTVLLIDDQHTALNIHAAILSSLNLKLHIVKMTDPVTALQWLKNKTVDLIITDFRMHQMNGIDFIRNIQAGYTALCPPMIVITAIKEHDIHQTLLAAGASICLTKPASTRELAKIARHLLSKNNHDHALFAKNNTIEGIV